MNKRKLDGKVLFGIIGFLALQITFILIGIEQESLVMIMLGTMLTLGLALFAVFIMAGKEERSRRIALRLLVATAFIVVETVLLVSLILMVRGGAY
jgi:hypothetical protein